MVRAPDVNAAHQPHELVASLVPRLLKIRQPTRRHELERHMDGRIDRRAHRLRRGVGAGHGWGHGLQPLVDIINRRFEGRLRRGVRVVALRGGSARAAGAATSLARLGCDLQAFGARLPVRHVHGLLERPSSSPTREVAASNAARAASMPTIAASSAAVLIP